MADKCIGNLTLNIDGVKKSVDEVNKMLESLGVGKKINISSKVTAAVREALKDVENLISQSEKKLTETTDKAIKSIESIGKTKQNEASIKQTISLYEKLYNARNRVYELEQKGQQGSVAYAKAVADAKKYESALRAVSEEVKKAAQATKEYNAIIDKSVSVQNAAKNTADAKETENATRAYIKLLEAKSKVKQLELEGQQDSVEYTKATQAAGQAYDAFLKYSDGARQAAQASKEAAQARKDLNAVEEQTTNTQEIENATNAYIRLLETRSKVKQLESEGKDNSLEYLKATQAAGKAYDAFIKYSEGAREAAKASKEAAQARKDLNAVEEKVSSDAQQPDYLANIKQKYFELTDAIKNYNIARQTGNTLEMSTHQAKIDGIMEEVGIIEQAVNASNLEEQAKQQVLNIIQQCTTAETQHNAEIGKSVGSTNELESQLNGLAMRYLSLMAVIRSINGLIQNTVEYVSEYSDKMNEIQMITMKSDAEVAQLAETYRNIASEMNASSLEMADAAIYFTRQGLPAEEIENRLKNVTMYAKAANVEFKDASEIITAVVNSMGLVAQEAEDGRNAAQRVADVFLNIGDNAATSGQEIGEAMQKAAASAGAFGVSMEWLASYIAAVSETTRQEARTIGTAFNTIIARLHQIKQTGYNSDDETKVNDIAKALSKIDVVLMDQNNNWRDMEDILVDIADKWGELDGKTKSYIATTMAGVKQQNVFLALMNDMSKGIEGESRAFELHELALKSNGVAAEKYSVYLDSVTASQERLTIAQEKFYSLLSDDVIKKWNDALATIVDKIANGADALNGINLIIPAVIAGISGIAVAINGMNMGLGHTVTLMEMLKKHPIMMGISAAVVILTTLVPLISTIGDAIGTSKKRFDEANTAIAETNQKIDEYRALQSQLGTMYNELGEKTQISTSELDKYNDVLSKLSKISPDAQTAVDDIREKMVLQKETVDELNGEIENLITNYQRLNAYETMKKLLNYNESTSVDTNMVQLYSQWDPAWFGGAQGPEGFRNALQSRYEYAKNQWGQGWRRDEYSQSQTKLTNEVYDFVKGMLEDGVDWDTIATIAWSEFFGGATSYEAKDLVSSSIKEMASWALDSITMNMNDFDKTAVQEKLMSLLFDFDGNARAETVEEANKVIIAFLNDAMNNFNFDPKQMMTPYERLLGFAKNIFGNISEEMYDSIVSQSDESVEKISEAYTEMIQAGISKADIKELLGRLSVDQWGDAIRHIKNQIIMEMSKASNESLHDVDENGNIDTLMWTDLDLSTLKLIQKLTEVGVTIETIKQAMRDSSSVDEFKNKLDNLSEDSGIEGEETVKTWKSIISEVEDAQKELKKLDTYIDTLSNGGKLTSKDFLDLASSHPEFIQYFGDLDTLKEKLIGLRSATANTAETSLRDFMLTDEDFFKATPFSGAVDSEGNNYKTLQSYIDSLEVGSAEYEAVTAYLNAATENMTKAAEELRTETENWLKTQAEAAEKASQLNYAKATGFESQLGELQRALSEDNGVQSAIDIWDSYDKDLQKSIATTYPNLIIALNNANKAMQKGADNADDLKDAQAGLNKELSKSQKYATAKYFKDSYAAIQKLENGTISATDAYETFNKEITKVSKAYEDILDVENKQANEAAVAASDVSNLASVLGMTAEEILEDFPGAVDMFNELTGSAGELTGVLNALNDAAFIKITGTSDADFSAIESGLISVQNLADEAVQKLLATGQWTTEVLELPQTAAIWHPGKDGGGYWSRETVNAGATILKPTGNNPFKGNTSVKKSNTSKKGGGGGGGGSSNEKNNNFSDRNTNTEVERMLDMMSQVNAIQESQQNFYQSQQKYNEQTGRIQGVIGYMEREKEVLENQNGTLEDNIRRIEEWMEKKRAEIATIDKTDEKYKEVADDLDKLQKAHQTYTKQLIDNKTAIDELTKAQEEQRKKIRQMEIDLRNTILKAIEDREKKTKDMLNAEIQMENTILDLITKRYEKERDQILKVTDMKIEALQQERDLLQEQLDLRKQQAEEEDKALKLRELEAKYQRIVADPTRIKEAQGIKDEIDALRKEMAWDAAEKEVKAQQDSIDQQITSLEDYRQYIEEYYEDLFEHPQKLIDEMRTIIMGTQEEIVEWLKANDEEYQKASENSRTAMVEGWEQTYNDMKGILTTYWEEVEEIISEGDDAIIEFLKNNSEEYAKAGRLQAEAYVDEWKKQLDDLKKAYEDVETELADDYDTIEQPEESESSGGSSSGGGGGGSGKGGKGKDEAEAEKHGYKIVFFGKTYEAEFDDYKTAGSEASKKWFEITDVSKKPNYLPINDWKSAKENATYKVYGNGGLADYTGPAWLDGTPSEPERILNPYQTKLFESMVQALEQIDKISIPGMPNYDAVATGGGSNVSVGDIIVNVDNLDTDDDYEELAEKVSEVLMERIGRTAMVGGIRVGSY